MQPLPDQSGLPTDHPDPPRDAHMPLPWPAAHTPSCSCEAATASPSVHPRLSPGHWKLEVPRSETPDASPKKAQGACGVGQEQGGDPTAWMAGRETHPRARARGKASRHGGFEADLDPGGGLTLTRKDEGSTESPWAPKPSSEQTSEVRFSLIGEFC